MGTTWETLGDHKGSKRGQRLSEDSSGEGLRKGPQYGPFLTSPGLSSGGLSPRREHSFHYFRKVAFGPHFEPFWAPFWIQESHYARPGGSRDAPGGSQGEKLREPAQMVLKWCFQELRESRSVGLKWWFQALPYYNVKDTRIPGLMTEMMN